MLRALQRVTPTIRCTAHRRRTFFSLPSTSIPHKSETQTYHERKILPYRRSELYKIIADVESYPNFLPYCASSRILESKVSQDGITVMEAELTVGFLAFRESYVSVVTCQPHESVEAVASSSTSLFNTLTTIWRLQPMAHPGPLSVSPHERFAPQTPADQGPTLVTLDLAFAFANPVHATVSGTFFGQVSKLMVNAFEQRCAALYGSRAH